MVLVVRVAVPEAGQTIVGDAQLRRRDGDVVSSVVSGTAALPRVRLALTLDGARVQLDGRVRGGTLGATWLGGALAGRGATLVRRSTRRNAGVQDVPGWTDE